MLPFCELEKSTYNWKYKHYPQVLLTVGDHIRRTRLERGLFQSQIADLLGVSEDTITYWENNRSQPQIQWMPVIINFLGYIPISLDTSTLAGRIKNFRLLKGLSHKKMAEILNVEPSTIASWEENTEPKKGKRKLINALLQGTFYYL